MRQISAMKLKRCMRKGCILYAIRVTNLLSIENKTNLGNHPILNEFSYVFLKEIPIFPPQREIDFSIELVPGSTSVSEIAYRMSIPELSGIKYLDTRTVT